MLIALQFPFADLRPFIPTDTGRVPRALLPNALPDREFVRGFGPVTQRTLGGLEEWPGEDIYCRATRAIRFDPTFSLVGKGFRTAFPAPRGVFRRFLSDGSAVARIEVGIGHRHHTTAIDLSADQIVTIVGDFLSAPVRVRSSTGKLTSCVLLRAADLLAGAFLGATTRRSTGTPMVPAPGWFTAGQPVALIEYRSHEISQVPTLSRKAPLPSITGASLDHYRIVHNGATLGVWLLRITDEADKGQVRLLRMHLFRLHAERQVLKNVLRAVARNEIPLARGSQQSDLLQAYLLSAVNLLGRKQRYGLPQSELLSAAQDIEDLVTKGERATLIASLEGARGNILRAVKRFTDEEDAAVKLARAAGPGASIYFFATGSTMSENKLRFGDNTTFHGDFVGIGNRLQNSLNKIGQSTASPDLKAELETLTAQVAEMVKSLPPEKAEDVSKDLEVLVSEATSPAPRRKWWELSVDGIKQAAQALGEIAAPVLATVAKVAAFLV